MISPDEGAISQHMKLMLCCGIQKSYAMEDNSEVYPDKDIHKEKACEYFTIPPNHITF